MARRRTVSTQLDDIIEQNGRTHAALRNIWRRLGRLEQGDIAIMTTTADIDQQLADQANDLQDLAGAVGTIDQALTDRTQELLDAIQNGADPTELQSIADKLQANSQVATDLKAAIDAAVAANPDPTPSTPDPGTGDGGTGGANGDTTGAGNSGDTGSGGV
jgi:uncharacterized phage infection (PIP) family protein YhgE